MPAVTMACVFARAVIRKGNLYKFNVSNPYETFHAQDIRKKQYVYEGGRKYRGMFIVGELQNPRISQTINV